MYHIVFSYKPSFSVGALLIQTFTPSNTLFSLSPHSTKMACTCSAIIAFVSYCICCGCFLQKSNTKDGLKTDGDEQQPGTGTGQVTVSTTKINEKATFQEVTQLITAAAEKAEKVKFQIPASLLSLKSGKETVAAEPLPTLTFEMAKFSTEELKDLENAFNSDDPNIKGRSMDQISEARANQFMAEKVTPVLDALKKVLPEKQQEEAEEHPFIASCSCLVREHYKNISQIYAKKLELENYCKKMTAQRKEAADIGIIDHCQQHPECASMKTEVEELMKASEFYTEIMDQIFPSLGTDDFAVKYNNAFSKLETYFTTEFSIDIPGHLMSVTNPSNKFVCAYQQEWVEHLMSSSLPKEMTWAKLEDDEATATGLEFRIDSNMPESQIKQRVQKYLNDNIKDQDRAATKKEYTTKLSESFDKVKNDYDEAVKSGAALPVILSEVLKPWFLDTLVPITYQGLFEKNIEMRLVSRAAFVWTCQYNMSLLKINEKYAKQKFASNSDTTSVIDVHAESLLPLIQFQSFTGFVKFAPELSFYKMALSETFNRLMENTKSDSAELNNVKLSFDEFKQIQKLLTIQADHTVRMILDGPSHDPLEKKRFPINEIPYSYKSEISHSLCLDQLKKWHSCRDVFPELVPEERMANTFTGEPVESLHETRRG